MERHSSNAMFISEIPVCYKSLTGNDEKFIQWIGNLNSSTTVRDIILSILPTCDPTNYSFYINIDRKKQILNNKLRIYKIISKINQQKTSKRLLFELCKKKRVRFADEILVQNIIQGQYCISNEIITKNIIETISSDKCLNKNLKRSSLKVINKNVLHSSNESSMRSTKIKLETLV